MEPTNYFDMTTELDPEPNKRITKYRMAIAFLVAVMACSSVFSDNKNERLEAEIVKLEDVIASQKKDIKLLTIIAESND